MTEGEEELAALRARVASLEAAAQRAGQSSEMLQLVLDTIPQFVFWKDRDSVYVGCNQNFAQAAGVGDVSEIVGKTDYDLAWKTSEADFFRACDRRVMDNDAPEFHIIEPQLQADGKEAWLDTNKVPLHDEAGNVVGILGTFEDITARKLAEDALAESEESLRITLESIGDAVIATDATGVVTRMNQVAETLTGWEPSAARGRSLGEVFHIVNGRTGARQQDPVSKVLAEGRVVGLANGTILVGRDGVRRQIADSGAPIRNRAGEIVGVVLVFRDVTQEHEIEEQLRQSQKLESIGQLAGGVAHDFNNALAGILGAAELLARDLPEATTSQLESLGLIMDAARSAGELTQKLLAFSRKGAIDLSPIDAHRSIGAAVELLRRTIDKTIDVVYQPDAEHTVVLGDDAQLQHAILNLGLNARDALGQGGRLEITTADVQVEDQEEGGPLRAGSYLEIRVRDDGSGIPAEHQRRIFEPFFTTKPVGEGTGLGLSAVYGAVVRHGGGIQVWSEVGQGTVFTLQLPVDRSTLPLPPPAEPATEVSSVQGRVLVVDDDPIVRLVAEGLLRRLGCDVVVAGSGREAIERFRDPACTIDLVLLDLVMPGLSGRESFFGLKAIDPQVKVLLSSGFARDQRVKDVLASGALGFLKKPYDLEQLSQAILNHLPAGGQGS